VRRGIPRPRAPTRRCPRDPPQGRLAQKMWVQLPATNHPVPPNDRSGRETRQVVLLMLILQTLFKAYRPVKFFVRPRKPIAQKSPRRTRYLRKQSSDSDRLRGPFPPSDELGSRLTKGIATQNVFSDGQGLETRPVGRHQRVIQCPC
jgi:hypothetical protein